MLVVCSIVCLLACLFSYWLGRPLVCCVTGWLLRLVAQRLQEFDTPLEGLTCRRGIAQIAPDRYARDGPEYEPWSSKTVGG